MIFSVSRFVVNTAALAKQPPALIPLVSVNSHSTQLSFPFIEESTSPPPTGEHSAKTPVERLEGALKSLLKHTTACSLSGGIIFATHGYLPSLTTAEVQSYPYLVESSASTRGRLLSSLDGAEFAALFARQETGSELMQLAFKEAASRQDKRVTALLARKAEDKSSALRLRALQTLSLPTHLGQPEAQRVFRRLVSSEEALSLRVYAIRMLSRAGNPDAVPFLKKSLSDESNSVVVAALIQAVEELERAAPHKSI